MSNKKTFDITGIPYNKTSLIEASAGTGKTYNITSIFERLVVEKGIDVKNILVVTFTEPATAELKTRIRKNLKDFCDNKKEQDKEYKRAKNALRMFDETNIFTIHGFCRKTLVENAFESRTDFDANITQDVSELYKDIIYDYFRKHFAHASKDTIAFLLKNRLMVNNLLELPISKILRPDIKVKINDVKVDIKELQDSIKDIIPYIKKINDILSEDIENIIRIILDSDVNKRSFGEAITRRRLNTIYELTNKILEENSLLINLIPLEDSKNFTNEYIKEKMKKDAANIPQHKIFDIFSQVIELFDQFESKCESIKEAILFDLITFLKKSIPYQKREKGIITFDDMIQETFVALSQMNFRKAISDKYKAVLVDEFQDTDILQYEIFKRLFFEKNKTSFMIGDPKQSIYKFRGADIFSYLKASRESDMQFTLNRNFRSEEGMIQAVNTIFSGENPFYIKELEYIKVSHPGEEKEDEKILVYKGDHFTNANCEIKIIKSDEDKPFSKKPDASSAINREFFSDITNLLKEVEQGKVLVDGKKLKNSDIAVLVDKNSTCKEIKKRLYEFGINSVVLSNESVLLSNMSFQLLNLLRAIEQHNNPKVIKAALCSDLLLGKKAIDIDQDELSDHITLFTTALSIFKKEGPGKALSFIDSEISFKKRLLLTSEAERNIADFEHLKEIILEDIYQNGMSISKLINQYERMLSDSTGKEQEQRIESDENAIRIITVHKSKGLQYRVVFYLSAWDPKVSVNNTSTAHIDDELKMDILGNDNDFKEKVKVEEFTENIRKFYVACTRSISRLYMYYPDYKAQGAKNNSAINYLFNYSFVNNSGEFNVEEKTYTDIETTLYNLNKLSKASKGSIRIIEPKDNKDIFYLEKDKKELSLVKKDFTRQSFEKNVISSFSGLIYGMEHIRMEREIPAERPLKKTAFDLPAGPKFGSMVHEIFEDITFQSSNETIREITIDKTRKYGFDEEWIVKVLVENVSSVLNAELKSSDGIFKLKDISDNDINKELYFMFPVKDLVSKKLLRLREQFVEAPHIFDKIEFERFSGYISGFIDMVFRVGEKYYIIDWKTNHLGYKEEDYKRENLSTAMEYNYYHLQYFLYSEALKRFLELRLEDYSDEKNWGGVFYLFTRGIRIGSDNGIYYDNLNSELFNSFSNIFKIGEES